MICLLTNELQACYSMCMIRLSTSELRPSELAFVRAMQKLEFGQFECVRIVGGELTLDPWPKMVKSIKFGGQESSFAGNSSDFVLKQQVVQFIHCVRGLENGEIRQLEVRHGLPFAMDLDCSACRISDDRLGAVDLVATVTVTAAMRSLNSPKSASSCHQD